MSRELQFIRRGERAWELTRVVKLRDGSHEYELIGRALERADGMWVAQLPLWQDIGHAWVDAELARPRMTRRAVELWLDANDGRPNPPRSS